MRRRRTKPDRVPGAGDGEYAQDYGFPYASQHGTEVDCSLAGKYPPEQRQGPKRPLAEE
ncbi:MAG: hypothetical protein AB1492_01040 [Bacillota bacterium]